MYKLETKTITLMAVGSYLSIITLNINGLNVRTKRQRLVEWIQKQNPYICCLQETHLKTGDTYRLKVKGSCFCIHSASLCLLVVAFNLFMFKVIIDKYDPVAIYFIVLGLRLYTLSVFPV